VVKVFITRKIPDEGIVLLKSAGYDVVVGPSDRSLSADELVSGGKGTDAVLTQLTNKITREILKEWKPSVKVVANYAMGYDNFDLKAAQEFDIVMTNTPDVLTNTVAEHTFALMLAVSHRIAEGDAFLRAGKYRGWEPELLLGIDLSGKVLGVLGCGRIGSRVIHHAVYGFGMNVLYNDIKRNDELEKEYGATYASLEDVLKNSDFVSLNVPLLASTRHLINSDRLKTMKPTAYLVNTSRGPVVDEAALADAIKNGVIKGAALDVFENEPEVNPLLLTLPNVVLTPHTASATLETRQKMSAIAAENIIAVLSGKPAPNQIHAL